MNCTASNTFSFPICGRSRIRTCTGGASNRCSSIGAIRSSPIPGIPWSVTCFFIIEPGYPVIYKQCCGEWRGRTFVSDQVRQPKLSRLAHYPSVNSPWCAWPDSSLLCLPHTKNPVWSNRASFVKIIFNFAYKHQVLYQDIFYPHRNNTSHCPVEPWFLFRCTRPKYCIDPKFFAYEIICFDDFASSLQKSDDWSPITKNPAISCGACVLLNKLKIHTIV